MTQTQTIEESLEVLENETRGYLWLESPIWESMENREVVGMNVKASSILRKDYAIARIKKVIEKFSLPLIVFDEKDYLNSFKIIAIVTEVRENEIETDWK